MAQQNLEVLEASPVDLAADVSHHRQTYLRFLKLMKWVSVGSAIVLLFVFFLLY
ncbi:MAG: aa3-type cytochrome c oxidase subunit IV [Bauldia sp.]|nr:aa3-type cytochrome c oxidase subunit IV [Bauldia sp.]